MSEASKTGIHGSMKSNLKLFIWVVLLPCIAGLLFSLGLHVATQEPKFWCDRQWAGVALYKGGYRSWTLTFCDGFQFENGKMRPVVITPKGIRKGYYRVPKYNHADLKRLGIAPPPR